MKTNKILAPSILSADFRNLSQQIRYVELGGADWIHCDVMDGKFVPNMTFGPLVVSAVRKITKLPLDVHLMVEKPDRLLYDFANAGASSITIHQEEVVHLNRMISKIHELKCKAGIALNPSTPLNTLENILEYVDMILILSVNPGFGGQEFIESSLNKISQLKKIRTENKLNFLIEVDGGIEKENIEAISKAGCDVFVVGSSIFKKDNITAATVELKNLLS